MFHIGEFLANEIETIITEIGTKKFCAIVTDGGSNCHVVREKISEKFPYISNVSCIVHRLNLITKDFISLVFVKRTIN